MRSAKIKNEIWKNEKWKWPSEKMKSGKINSAKAKNKIIAEILPSSANILAHNCLSVFFCNLFLFSIIFRLNSFFRITSSGFNFFHQPKLLNILWFSWKVESMGERRTQFSTQYFNCLFSRVCPKIGALLMSIVYLAFWRHCNQFVLIIKFTHWREYSH